MTRKDHHRRSQPGTIFGATHRHGPDVIKALKAAIVTAELGVLPGSVVDPSVYWHCTDLSGSMSTPLDLEQVSGGRKDSSK